MRALLVLMALAVGCGSLWSDTQPTTLHGPVVAASVNCDGVTLPVRSAQNTAAELQIGVQCGFFGEPEIMVANPVSVVGALRTEIGLVAAQARTLVCSGPQCAAAPVMTGDGTAIGKGPTVYRYRASQCTNCGGAWSVTMGTDGFQRIRVGAGPGSTASEVGEIADPAAVNRARTEGAQQFTDRVNAVLGAMEKAGGK